MSILKYVLYPLSLAMLTTTPCLAATNGLYLGAQAGYDDSNVSTNNKSLKTDQSHLGERGYAGLQLFHLLALEGGYTRFGSTEVKGVNHGSSTKKTLSKDAADLVLKGNIPLGDKVDIFAKGGAAYVMADTVSSHVLNSSSIKINSTNQLQPTASVGADYNLTQNISADLTYMVIPSRGNVQTSKLTSVGLSFHL
jgi:opacity protein-like surface antigen